ncbi:MAG: hypothetical protein AAF639_15740 [Chloroflexota bacterium]
MARRYTKFGVASTPIEVTTADNPDHPKVAIDDAGNFIVTWYAWSGASEFVRAQRYNAEGVAQGSMISVDQYCHCHKYRNRYTCQSTCHQHRENSAVDCD